MTGTDELLVLSLWQGHSYSMPAGEDVFWSRDGSTGSRPARSLLIGRRAPLIRHIAEHQGGPAVREEAIDRSVAHLGLLKVQ